MIALKYNGGGALCAPSGRSPAVERGRYADTRIAQRRDRSAIAAARESSSTAVRRSPRDGPQPRIAQHDPYPETDLSTPDLHLHTLFVLNDAGRIMSNREPGASRGPLFFLVRSAARCSWAIRSDVPDALATELDGLAREEPPLVELGDAPVHADKYVSVLGDRPLSTHQPSTAIVQSAGPAFSFPTAIEKATTDIVFVEDERLLEHNFRGWVPGEIAAGSGPVAAVMVDGHPVSICFSARTSDAAAEAGVETAERFRGRGLAGRVTAAWAIAVRASGRVPLYSTAWTNTPSLAVARKLGLIAYASSWSLSDSSPVPHN